ncbi:MAG: UDP-glucose dehydrogenase family protein [Gemmatimonadota bacterium]
MDTISVIGLGKLGAPIAACLASKGYRVIGVDVDAGKVELINRGIAPVLEPGLEELLRQCRETLSATDDIEGAVVQSDVSFIIVPTPSAERGAFSVRHVIEVCKLIGAGMRTKGRYHLVVVTSTVLPGAIEQEVKPVLERHSGARCGVDFGLCYNPTFVALGSAIRDFMNPDVLVIGEADTRAGDTLLMLYRNMCENNPRIARMNFVNAEITKLAVNTYVTTKITFANMLARICEHTPGTDVDVVTFAMGLDSRIGAKCLRGAVGYGGPCFPRDNLALAYFGRVVGAAASLAEVTDRANREQVPRLAAVVKSRLRPGGSVAILGLSYKPGTDVVDESQGLLLAKLLSEDGVSVAVYDPWAMDNARKKLDGSARFAQSAQECVGLADVIVIVTPWEEFQRMPARAFGLDKQRKVVIDCWRVMRSEELASIAEYVPLGVGLDRWQ